MRVLEGLLASFLPNQLASMLPTLRVNLLPNLPSFGFSSLSGRTIPNLPGIHPRKGYSSFGSAALIQLPAISRTASQRSLAVGECKELHGLGGVGSAGDQQESEKTDS